MTISEAIEKLEKREQWLTKRIARAGNKRLSFDEGERAALRIAIKHLREEAAK